MKIKELKQKKMINIKKRDPKGPQMWEKEWKSSQGSLKGLQKVYFKV